MLIYETTKFLSAIETPHQGHQLAYDRRYIN